MLKLKDQIRKVLEKEPLLTFEGLGIYRALGDRRGNSERTADFKERREALFDATTEFAETCKLLKKVVKTKTINRKALSYGLKHAAERTIGRYVSNGTLIAAAIHCGFDYRKQYYGDGSLSLNVLFNMSQNSIYRVFVSRDQRIIEIQKKLRRADDENRSN